MTLRSVRLPAGRIGRYQDASIEVDRGVQGNTFPLRRAATGDPWATGRYPGMPVDEVHATSQLHLRQRVSLVAGDVVVATVKFADLDAGRRGLPHQRTM